MSQSLRCMKYIILYHRNILGCSFDLTATEINQTFRSLNYPSNYPHNLFCTWNITAQNEMRVSLVILDFETEANYDKLTVSKNRPTIIKILIYC